jgi:hypothetical protein
MNIQIYEFTNWEKPIPDQWIQYVFISGKHIVLRIDFRNQVLFENDIFIHGLFDYHSVKNNEHWKRIA